MQNLDFHLPLANRLRAETSTETWEVKIDIQESEAVDLRYHQQLFAARPRDELPVANKDIIS